MYWYTLGEREDLNNLLIISAVVSVTEIGYCNQLLQSVTAIRYSNQLFIEEKIVERVTI